MIQRDSSVCCRHKSRRPYINSSVHEYELVLVAKFQLVRCSGNKVILVTAAFHSSLQKALTPHRKWTLSLQQAPVKEVSQGSQ